jgi:hypothetical protein
MVNFLGNLKVSIAIVAILLVGIAVLWAVDILTGGPKRRG